MPRLESPLSPGRAHDFFMLDFSSLDKQVMEKILEKGDLGTRITSAALGENAFGA